jgi:hypothetical protein
MEGATEEMQVASEGTKGTTKSDASSKSRDAKSNIRGARRT